MPAIIKQSTMNKRPRPKNGKKKFFPPVKKNEDVNVPQDDMKRKASSWSKRPTPHLPIESDSHNVKESLSNNVKPEKKKWSRKGNHHTNSSSEHKIEDLPIQIKTVIKPKSKNPCDILANWKQLQEQLRLRQNQHNERNESKDKGALESKESSHKDAIGHRLRKDEIWFDDVEPEIIEKLRKEGKKREREVKDCDESTLIAKNKEDETGLTKAVAIDCEMVGYGYHGRHSQLARVSIVNMYGHCLYDKFVKPREKVTDYRTWVSGVRPEDLQNAEPFEKVQKEVHDLVKGRILVGHALKNDLECLVLSHPKHLIRDTSPYFRKLQGGKSPSLKSLSKKYLGVKVQSGEHSSVQDAQATMRLYMMFRKKWEASLSKRDQIKKKKMLLLKKQAEQRKEHKKIKKEKERIEMKKTIEELKHLHE